MTLLTGDPSDPRFDPPTFEEQDYLREHFKLYPAPGGEASAGAQDPTWPVADPDRGAHVKRDAPRSPSFKQAA